MMPLTWGLISATRYADVRPGNSVVSSICCGCTVMVATSGTGGGGDCCRRSQPNSSSTETVRNKKIAGPGDVRMVQPWRICLLYFPWFKGLAPLLEKTRLDIAVFSWSFFSIKELLERPLDLGYAIRQFTFKGCSLVLGHLLRFLESVFVLVDLCNEFSLYVLKLSPGPSLFHFKLNPQSLHLSF